MAADALTVANFMWGVGVTAAVIFYGRFYIQWIASELRGESVFPITFWYMSAVGSVLLLCYAGYEQSPVGALSHSFNIIIYARNLIHIWREQGTLTRMRRKIMNAIMIVVVLGALAILAHTWYQEYVLLEAQPSAQKNETWFWIGVGVVGQLLFGVRVSIQWIASERARKSVVPLAFWYFSIAATLMLVMSHFHQAEWIFFFGNLANILIYSRNLWLIHLGKPAASETNTAG